MNSRRILVQAALALPLGLQWRVSKAADNHDHGSPFTKLKTPQPVSANGTIEVIEFFWYGCPHCKQLEPALEAWERGLPADVVLRREHVVWEQRKPTLGEARFFATLRTMGIVPQHQKAVFDWVQGDRGDLNDEKSVLAWVAKRGIDRARFESVYKSFVINSQVTKAKQLTSAYEVQSVPHLVVNGKYATSPHQAGGERQMLAVIDRLIANERSTKP